MISRLFFIMALLYFLSVLKGAQIINWILTGEKPVSLLRGIGK